MVKGSAEGPLIEPSRSVSRIDVTTLERIMQIGKKKLALDHIIVQKMDDELGEDVQSILTFGAQQLFQDEGTDRGITCSWMHRVKFTSKLTPHCRFRCRHRISDREDRKGRGKGRGE